MAQQEPVDWGWVWQHALTWACGDAAYADWYVADHAWAEGYEDLQDHRLAWSRYLDEQQQPTTGA